MSKEIEKTNSAKKDFMDAIEMLRPDLLYPEVWSESQQKTVDRVYKGTKNTVSTMYSSIPMKCALTCPIKEQCELYREGRAPLGFPCPFELNLIRDFVTAFMEELDVDPDNLIEVSSVRKMVDQEIQYIRKSQQLANEGFIVENVVGVDDMGRPIVKKELSLAVELEDKLHRRMKDLKNQFIATREAKVKAGTASKDAISAMSDLVEKIKDVDRGREEELRKRLGVIDTDAYIEED